jgi:hypothetical protein
MNQQFSATVPGVDETSMITSRNHVWGRAVRIKETATSIWAWSGFSKQVETGTIPCGLLKLLIAIAAQLTSLRGIGAAK